MSTVQQQVEELSRQIVQTMAVRELERLFGVKFVPDQRERYVLEPFFRKAVQRQMRLSAEAHQTILRHFQKHPTSADEANVAIKEIRRTENENAGGRLEDMLAVLEAIGFTNVRNRFLVDEG